MRLLNYLREKWATSFKDPLAGGTTEVFVNPSRSEYKDAIDASKGAMLHPASVRAFYSYESDKIWVWRGDVLHNKVMKKIPEINFHTLRIVIEPSKKFIHVYELFKSDKEEMEIAAMAVKKIHKFAPETKGFKVVRPNLHKEFK